MILATSLLRIWMRALHETWRESLVTKKYIGNILAATWCMQLYGFLIIIELHAMQCEYLIKFVEYLICITKLHIPTQRALKILSINPAMTLI